MMFTRAIGLYLKYWQARIKYHGRVKFNGFTVIYAFPNSSIEFDGGGKLSTLMN